MESLVWSCQCIALFEKDDFPAVISLTCKISTCNTIQCFHYIIFKLKTFPTVVMWIKIALSITFCDRSINTLPPYPLGQKTGGDFHCLLIEIDECLHNYLHKLNKVKVICPIKKLKLEFEKYMLISIMCIGIATGSSKESLKR